MRISEVVPHTLRSMDHASTEGREWLAELYAPARENHVRLNMVTSLTGAAVGADGTSETLTSPVDRAVLGVIRRACDVVVVGAQTVRAEGYVIPRTAMLAILTGSGDLSGHRFDEAAAAERVLVVCPPARVDGVRERVRGTSIEVISAGADDDASASHRVDPGAVIERLRDRGLRRVVCEGGPSLAAQFVRAGAVDEACVSVAPTLSPAERPFIDVDADTRSHVSGMLVDEAGFSYLRLALDRPAPS
ncbi:dihydrofolate reductase family protein [Microbacterium sp. LRZ72]|uniref:dihydrofolate reductase family protein n=1 Tax=Microbacterium sp. LRZ72 TaxID=2942481 RepID=UPI00299F91E9|nr:dihydrofolate reductase family protein [Microbacterium sp. LRZ72]MDX2375352.1 dihydrofolate reductase family protein [Microbacterium sp. LRZ72]